MKGTKLIMTVPSLITIKFSSLGEFHFYSAAMYGLRTTNTCDVLKYPLRALFFKARQ
jgi:hypothetical protein